ncbi:MAG TPA: aspartate/glutamate racemase family protein [Anaerolineaceae bacterium]|nr:aspartate/glutamate racemase family protein [Anaerolineaceae bacterium]HPN53250.1 aspartate/glutamate racemase family protein [Anaerolineaceae bacterium]
MKTIGLIGGMSWESTAQYYALINEQVRDRLGGLHSARCILYSVDFAEIEAWQHAGDWAQAGQAMAEAARSLERAGADCVVLCTNTMHRLAGEIEAAISIPFLHIADAAAGKIQQAGLARVGLLGTRFTMEQDFYRRRLREKFGLDVLTPESADRQMVHDVIYNELCLGIIRPESRADYARVIEKLVQAGAQGIILGCTEIELLVQPADSPVPLFPTTAIHAAAAVDWALNAETK